MAESLKEFVIRHTCVICKLEPVVRAELEQGIKDGVTTYMMAKWLKTEYGLSVTPSTVENHKENRQNKHA